MSSELIDTSATVKNDALNKNNGDWQPDLLRNKLDERYVEIRGLTEKICQPLHPEDYVVQSMSNASPAKWHIAHVTWFFETFVLKEFNAAYTTAFPQYDYLFNSYYVQAGERFTREYRGLLSRPSVQDVYNYRKSVDDEIRTLLQRVEEARLRELAAVMEIGFNHEQQHQELMITDLKHMLSINPLNPAYQEKSLPEDRIAPALDFISFEEGLYEVGHDGGAAFSFDNELPRHRTFLEGFELASRLVTNAEYMAFMKDKGYENQVLWLSDGWPVVESEAWEAPAYWIKNEGEWHQKTLYGLQKVHPQDPVSHVSYYEADAYARWASARLPREAEWEVAARQCEIKGQLAEDGVFQPVASNETSQNGLYQIYGSVWEWTQSPYTPYPGYKPLEGALGEYNGKFMANQFVLKGGSCATSKTHIRPTYRNFFHPPLRWQFTGIRLAK